ncbi:DUF2235 domain-containing protein [Wenzhouxiangella sp. AB-CW3]|uniref:DUF2235 domain-containing protein n=1 Tax=Wenzhouxiangella sp. AB-CW3 TaxID=2771012 RepID=UPI00168B8EF8|nr:DUF2235 domain-containing protein [Wenzhouxiangella sp. AB-CW3]QOC22728.1 DUF2235 domain-containing protein [Wenzhouxiangella sp. AB-CW3]
MDSPRSTPRLAGRNLIVLSDGTGNRGGVTRDTNVWRLYKAIDRHQAPVEQRVRYDDGVGTDDMRIAKALGGAFGIGLTRNVTGFYAFLARNYRPGDRIYLLGFSRGAFTVRVLAGMLARCGLWTQQGYFAEEEPERLIRKRILPAYRSLGDRKVRALREEFDLHPEVYIRFLGVWDTVDAVGMPVDELKVLLEVCPRLFCNRRGYGFHDRELSGWVRTARQALSIDDDRRTFHPNVWSTRKAPGERAKLCQDVEQVWFAGAHSNVGGGYPKDGLAFVTLDWMLGEIDSLGSDRIWLEGDTARPLLAGESDPPAMALFKDDGGQRFAVHSSTRVAIQHQADAQGRHYEPRTGAGLFYRYHPRWLERTYTGEKHGWARWLRLPELPGAWHRRLGIPWLTPAPRRIPVHVSVRQRLLQGTQDYAPYTLPANVEIVHTRGPGPFSGAGCDESSELPEADAARHVARGPVLWRRLAYGINLLGTLALIVALFGLPYTKLWRFLSAPGLDQLNPLVTLLLADPWLKLAVVLLVPGLLLNRWARRRLRQHTRRTWRKVLLRARLLP